jgi:predicted 3-demethylubiquinone-9 3-methyltransferase (glyoxalase superfamily)
MFTKELTGNAEAAIKFYCSVFKDGKIGHVEHYPEGAAPDAESSVMYGDFQIMDTWLAAMDGGKVHDFAFSEAVSLLIPCDSQEEIDYYWERLSAVPESEQCGWLKDKFGVSWQVHAAVMDEMMANGTPEQIDRVTQAFLPMKKLDIETIKKAFAGEA